MSDDFPRIVNPDSFDLSEFPTEGGEGQPPAPAPSLAELEVRRVELAPSRPESAPAAPAGPATITEFPVKPPPTPVLSEAPAGVPLIDLIEQHGGLDWRQAVAVVHQICGQLQNEVPQSPILLEARNILITNQGEVQLLPGQTGGDPLVIQVGRLLRTMLMSNEAPPELRLLLSQATFELPIFESLEDVERALRQLERLEDDSADRSGFVGPLPLPPPADETYHQYAVQRSILPAPHVHRRRHTSGALPPLGKLLQEYASRIITASVVIAIVGAIFLTYPSLMSLGEPSAGSARTADTIQPPLASPQVPEHPALAAVSAAPSPSPILPAAGATAARPSPARSMASASGALGAVQPKLDLASGSSRSTASTVIGATASLRESERRATQLLAQGQTVEAALAFDALVMSNPLYEPKASELTPESLAAFRTSQRLLLPVIAQRTYDRARAALAGGDADRALRLGKDTVAILERPLTNAPPELREQVQELLAAATAAKMAAEEVVYSESDRGVIGPRPLSRQFPLTPPIGVPPHRVGTLEIVVGKEGNVDFVKLHTPLNRYHERMIVSAAKAWTYQPATKDGRPVKCRIMVKVNLPESGTDD
jgi:hypothetical protein